MEREREVEGRRRREGGLYIFERKKGSVRVWDLNQTPTKPD